MYDSERSQWFSARDYGIYYFVTSGDITRQINALDIPSFSPDQILLDNYVMSRFGAVLYLSLIHI